MRRKMRGAHATKATRLKASRSRPFARAGVFGLAPRQPGLRKRDGDCLFWVLDNRTRRRAAVQRTFLELVHFLLDAFAAAGDGHVIHLLVICDTGYLRARSVQVTCIGWQLRGGVMTTPTPEQLAYRQSPEAREYARLAREWCEKVDRPGYRPPPAISRGGDGSVAYFFAHICFALALGFIIAAIIGVH